MFEVEWTKQIYFSFLTERKLRWAIITQEAAFLFDATFRLFMIQSLTISGAISLVLPNSCPHRRPLDGVKLLQLIFSLPYFGSEISFWSALNLNMMKQDVFSEGKRP